MVNKMFMKQKKQHNTVSDGINTMSHSSTHLN